jgi:hypothetical protein
MTESFCFVTVKVHCNILLVFLHLPVMVIKATYERLLKNKPSELVRQAAERGLKAW